jgi:hypothetical protein
MNAAAAHEGISAPPEMPAFLAGVALFVLGPAATAAGGGHLLVAKPVGEGQGDHAGIEALVKTLLVVVVGVLVLVFFQVDGDDAGSALGAILGRVGHVAIGLKGGQGPVL